MIQNNTRFKLTLKAKDLGVGSTTLSFSIYLFLYFLDLLEDTLSGVARRWDKYGDRNGEGEGDRDRVGRSVHMKWCRNIDGHGNGDEHPLVETFVRLSAFKTWHRPARRPL